MKFRGYMLNALIRAGHNEDAAEAALEAVHAYLRNREAELRAEGLHADAVWYARLRNEMRLARHMNITRPGAPRRARVVCP
jgi:hypothetical protein